MKKLCLWIPLCLASSCLYAEGGNWSLGSSLLTYDYEETTVKWDNNKNVLAYTDVTKSENLLTVPQNVTMRYFGDRWAAQYAFAFAGENADHSLSGMYSFMPNWYAETEVTLDYERTLTTFQKATETDTKAWNWGLGVGSRYYKQKEMCILDAGLMLSVDRKAAGLVDVNAGDQNNSLFGVHFSSHTNYYHNVLEHIYAGGGLAFNWMIAGKNTQLSQGAALEQKGKSTGWSLDVELLGLRAVF
jgi:hypothetical protein